MLSERPLGYRDSKGGEIADPPYVQHKTRRDYSLSYKLRIVEETFRAGVSVSVVSRRENVNTNVIFRWRKLYREGRLGGSTAGELIGSDGFIELGRIGVDGSLEAVAAGSGREDGGADRSDEESGAGAPGGRAIALEIGGQIRLRFGVGTDTAYLKRVIQMVRGL